MILIRKRPLHRWSLRLCSLLGAAAVLWGSATLPSRPIFAPAEGNPAVWIVDAGHGGEDGGAVSPDGVQESHINLEVALRLHALLRFAGQQARLIRQEDSSVCDEGLATIRARKASDIRNRVARVNETTGAILVSVHQNSLPSSPETHGAQVFWNRQPGGEALAETVQEALNGAVNPERPKQSRRIPDTIYLMKHVTAPAILVECGFLSNREETARLQEPSYQRKLAAAITAGCLRGLAGEDAP